MHNGTMSPKKNSSCLFLYHQTTDKSHYAWPSFSDKVFFPVINNHDMRTYWRVLVNIHS